MKYLSLIIFSLLFFTSCEEKSSNLKIHGLFTDNAVLQQNNQVAVWGWASEGSKVKLSAEWGEEAESVTYNNGRWEVLLQTPSAGGPFSLEIGTNDTVIILNNIMIGEVWLASGQSNMTMPLKGWPPNNTINNSLFEISKADYPDIRMFNVERSVSYEESTDVKGTWEQTNPEIAGNFSAAAYFFARELHEKLNVPVGIIHSSWGGTPAEAWTEVNGLKTVPEYKDKAEKLTASLENIGAYNKWLRNLKHIDLDSINKKNPYLKLALNDTLYKDPNYDDSGWNEMKLPSYWEKQKLGNYDGVVWFRKEFNMPENISSGDYSFYLGMIDDMDDTYINGIKLGSHLGEGYWNFEREYKIAAGMLKPGKNVIAVRVIDTRGDGGIYGNKDITIRKNGKKTVNLSGSWKYKPTAIISVSDLYIIDDSTSDYSSAPKMSFSLSSHTPSHIYNGMIAPLIPYAIKGVIWYQGESNVGRGKEYQTLFPALIKSWRLNWNLGEFPFYYVQIAPCNYGETHLDAPVLRHAQLLTLKEENTGMVVTTDIGDINNFHPGNKQDVGKRLALCAFGKTYEIDSICYSGPIYKDYKIEKNKIVVSFDHIDSGLLCNGNKLKLFEIAGTDTVFYLAKAIITGDKVEVWSDKIHKPKFVRFGWSDIAEPNLFNNAGLPASPFRNY